MSALLLKASRALAFAIVALSAVPAFAADARPNFVIIVADDMAWDDSQPYGHDKIETPQLRRLASEGLRFDRAFLTCSSCSPSRCSILTGRYPHATGAMRLHEPLPADQVIFPEALRSAGYFTAAVGKWHLGPMAVAKFDEAKEKDFDWVAALRKRPKDKPFFFWFAATDPHRPYKEGAVARGHAPFQVQVPPYLPDTPAVRDDLRLYYDEIGRLDKAVGQVLDELFFQRVDKNTFVLFLSDNGRPFPRCKTTVYDSGVKTPFLVRWPNGVKGNTHTEALVSSVDIGPTVLELAGVKSLSTFQGQSFANVLKDPNAEARHYAFSEHNWHDFDDHGRAVRSARYRYIKNTYADVPGTPPADAVRSATFQEMRRLRDANQLKPEQMTCFTAPRPNEELYDLDADPHELKNLATDPMFDAVLKSHREALDNWTRETADFVPEKRTPDDFDRETGEPKRAGKKKSE